MTEKQKKVMADQLQNPEKSIKQSMMESGYSEGSANKSNRLTQSKDWVALLDKYLPDKLLAEVHQELLKSNDWKAREVALAMAYKIKGKFSEDEQKPFLPINITVKKLTVPFKSPDINGHDVLSDHVVKDVSVVKKKA